MKLVDLEPNFIGGYRENDGPRGDGVSYLMLPSAEGAQGILFECPKCRAHMVLCWFKNPRNAAAVPDSALPRPGRWEFTGDTFDVLSLQPSIDISQVNEANPEHPSRCYWHGWVTNGEAT